MRKLRQYVGTLGLAVIGGACGCSQSLEPAPPSPASGLPALETSALPRAAEAEQTTQPSRDAASASPAPRPDSEIAWAKSFEDAQQEAARAKKLIMVDFYTDW